MAGKENNDTEGGTKQEAGQRNERWKKKGKLKKKRGKKT